MPEWTVQAKRDLQEHLTHIANEDPDAARHMAMLLKVCCAELDEFPKVGCPCAVKDAHELVIPDTAYTCVYRIVKRRVEILRLLHTRRMWPE